MLACISEPICCGLDHSPTDVHVPGYLSGLNAITGNLQVERSRKKWAAESVTEGANSRSDTRNKKRRGDRVSMEASRGLAAPGYNPDLHNCRRIYATKFTVDVSQQQ